jgi:hypothetical protein
MAGSSAAGLGQFVALAVGGLFLLLPSCSSSPPATHRYASPAASPGAVSPRPAAVPTSLWRPYHLPTVAAGQRCPVTTPLHVISPDFAPAAGRGPVYPVGLSSTGVIPFEYPPPANSQFGGSEWGGQKVLWVVRNSYRGPVLLRGHQLDGSNEVRFEGDPVPAVYLFLAGSGGIPDPRFHEWPSYTRLRASGCYAWQVDGTTFSEVIVFRARATAPLP